MIGVCVILIVIGVCGLLCVRAPLAIRVVSGVFAGVGVCFMPWARSYYWSEALCAGFLLFVVVLIAAAVLLVVVSCDDTGE